MSYLPYPSLDKALSGLCFGLNQAGLEKLQARGIFTEHTIRSLADTVMSTWRMRNDAFFIRFNDTPDGFGFVYESHITSIEDAWNEYAQHWVAYAEDYFSGEWSKRQTVYRVYPGGKPPRTIETLRGFLPFAADRGLYDRPLLEAVMDNKLTFDLYKARVEHLQKLAENHIKRHAKRFHLNQITDTTDPDHPVFAEFA